MNQTSNIVKTKRQHNKPVVSRGVSLTRWGGLNMVKQKGNYGNDTFHSAPERHGFYAFMFPFIDLFLIACTKNKEFDARLKKDFHATDGYIWTHLKPKNVSEIIAIHNCWYKVHVSTLNKLVQRAFATDCAHVQTSYFFEDQEKRIPYKGREGIEPKVVRLNSYGSLVSIDHLEVFVCRDTIISS